MVGYSGTVTILTEDDAKMILVKLSDGLVSKNDLVIENI